ncbi:CDP-diacylglycerol--glycerol-3-phosphate 3-phosphatidyltransferase [Pustulibacterium marinum]|uniref:CDP-diacylglycerol--glycerol-3-phosphate 3-phosphatidyltransferase n=1 Tax=Pustulibacterium marinum TaxID=1224947 RepID=A0A1I7I1T6_9FLAO|nr:CDP-alcohol phosphatidyltransferase family protein [Pustulibacterium marinum]SFU66922.1 CDP-diacylglycerol--glycerol-3-phosphate 3-phosphatidyltransferase [Pustulibacterium marinum]
MKKIPFLLIYSRIVLCLLIALLAILKMDNYAIWIVAFMSLGLITDIFDGIIARKLNASTEKLRIWDSNVDQFFWMTIIVSIFYLNIDFLKENYVWIGIVIFLELLAYVFSYWKFKKSIATHSILAKFWTLSLLWFLIDLVLNSSSQIPFIVCIFLGILSRIEIHLIIINLKNWTTDVPSIWVVSKINRGIAIKKNKLFNS